MKNKETLYLTDDCTLYYRNNKLQPLTGRYSDYRAFTSKSRAGVLALAVLLDAVGDVTNLMEGSCFRVCLIGMIADNYVPRGFIN